MSTSHFNGEPRRLRLSARLGKTNQASRRPLPDDALFDCRKRCTIGLPASVATVRREQTGPTLGTGVLIASIVSVDPFGNRLRPGTEAGFVVLVAFLVSFLAIRTSARLTRSVSWWPGGVESGGVHIHHLVWGICLMMLCGFLAFAAPLGAPWWHIVAVGFGVGVGVTMDEFALWVRLQDVYWTQEGRTSFDAGVVAAAFAGLVVLGTQPFGLDDPASIAGTALAVTLVFGLTLMCLAKGRVLLGVIGLFVPVVALVASLRLARPSSLWARRRYSGRRLERAEARFAPTRRATRWQRRIADLVVGAPNATATKSSGSGDADSSDHQRTLGG
jgi:hypothetical protein